MARKESVTKTMILDAAVQMAREDGLENVTARKLAGRIGCSTQPIFRAYTNMPQLYAEVYRASIDIFDEYYGKYEAKVETPFLYLGLAYIDFAKAERQLFRLLFLSEHRGDKSLYELLNGSSGALTQEINKAAAQGCANPSGLFMKMWIFIHGCACMVLTGDYDLTKEETLDLLEDIYKSCSRTGVSDGR